jgi:hypothetical protein
MRKALYLVIGLLSVMVVGAPAYTGQLIGTRPTPSVRDVSAVRRAYMILSTLNRLDRYEMIYALTNSREDARRADFLSFKLSLLGSGPIHEILSERLYDLVTPRGGDVLVVMRETHHADDDPIMFVSYESHWKAEPQPAPDKRTVLEIMGDVISKEKYDRYMQYEVTVTDGIKTRDYRAMALLGGSLEEGMTGSLSFVDLILDGDPLGFALAETLPPLRVPFLQFIRSRQYRDLVERARRGQSLTVSPFQNQARGLSLSSAAAPTLTESYACPLGYLPDLYGCCNESTLHCCFPFEWTGICGTSKSDSYCTCGGSGGGGGDPGGGAVPPPICSQTDVWATPLLQDWRHLQFHDTSRPGNQHSGWMKTQGHCRRNRDCLTTGEVIEYGMPPFDTFDSQNTTDNRCHKIGVAGDSKACTTTRGGECTASRAIGFGVRACPDCSCSVSVQLTYSGVGWTVAASDAFFSWALHNEMVCVGR